MGRVPKMEGNLFRAEGVRCYIEMRPCMQPDKKKLEFFKFFQQGTKGDCRGTDLNVHAIYGMRGANAWFDIRGMSKKDARKKYVDLVAALEWDGASWQEWYERNKPAGDHLPHFQQAWYTCEVPAQ